MEIYIIRHGETVWNIEARLQGDTDIALNENGRRLAGLTGELLDGTPFDCIYSSPLIRAYETACLIRGRRDIPIIRDDRMREISFGRNEGRRKEELERDEHETFRYFFSDPVRYRAPEDGESLEDVCRRTAEFMREIVEPQAERFQRIMIVGHGAVNKAVMCHIAGRDIGHYWTGGLQKNCGIILVRYGKEGYQVISEHLSLTEGRPE